MPYTELIEDRLRFLEIDEHDIVELQQARQYLEPEMDQMLERFYAHILSYPEFKALFEDEESINRARASQKAHWLEELFGGHYKSSYFNKTDKIGRTHARVGLAPSWYIGSYSKMLTGFIECICKEAENEGRAACETIQAVCKAVLLDVDLVIHSYLEAKNEAMRQVLRRATKFAADVAELGAGMSDASRKVRDSAAALAETQAEADGLNGELQDLLDQVACLTEHSGAIEERIGKLRFGDRLFIEDDPTTLDRLKSLLSRE
ncbi:MAG TPA: protoglobin domain-containing protein [Woeseiaceae bacterium]|nr:protoglobin domain-containing protein [Woeseiaceae bacterium]